LTVNIRLVDSPLRPAEFVIVRIGQWIADGKASGGSMNDNVELRSFHPFA